jgi:hypothetical protein
MKKREAQAYVPNSTKHPAPPSAEYSIPNSGGKAPDLGDQSRAPKVSPGMQPEVPQGPWMAPDNGSGRPMAGGKYELGDQSKAPSHKKAAMTMRNAPVDVKGVNEGHDYPLPKSGGKGETEV